MAFQPAYRTTSVRRDRLDRRASMQDDPPVPMTGASDVVLRLPVALQVRLAAESLLTGRAADEIVAEALADHLRRHPPAE